MFMTRVAVNSGGHELLCGDLFVRLLVLMNPHLFPPPRNGGVDEGGGLYHTNWPPAFTDTRLPRSARVVCPGLAKLENFLPKFVVLGKLLIVSDSQGVNLFRSHLVGRLDLRMGGYAAADSHSFLSFLREHPAIP